MDIVHDATVRTSYHEDTISVNLRLHDAEPLAVSDRWAIAKPYTLIITFHRVNGGAWQTKWALSSKVPCGPNSRGWRDTNVRAEHFQYFRPPAWIDEQVEQYRKELNL